MASVTKMVLVAVAMFGGAAAAVAVEPTNTRAAMVKALDAEFDATDTNKDGVLSPAEVQKRMGHMKLANGKSFSELQVKKLAAMWFARTDLDHNGKVTKAESRKTAEMLFDRYDTNHDGVISGEERHAAEMAARAEGGAPGR